jgi:hypothetical protein
VGTIIGYETGGTPSHYGSPKSFRLKNSGIDFIVSTRYLTPMKALPGDDERGVLPDIAVNRELLIPYKDEPDPGICTGGDSRSLSIASSVTSLR